MRADGRPEEPEGTMRRARHPVAVPQLPRRLVIGLPAAAAVAAAGAAGLATIRGGEALAQRRGGGGAEPPSPGRRTLPGPPQLGVFVGNSPKAVLRFERWLGRRVDGVVGFVGQANWDEIATPSWPMDLWRPLDRPVFWSVPLIPSGGVATLEQAARGAYDHHWRSAARLLATFRPRDPHLHVRTAWEFNGDWFPWAAKGKEAAFVAAFRRFVGILRATSPRFLIEWNANYDGEMDPEQGWPGAEFVDVIGMDFYWHTQWAPSDPVRAWEQIRDRRRGLRWHQEFAAAQNRPTAYSEWGVTTDNAAPFLERAHAWFNAHNVLFHNYWDSDADYPGQLSNGRRGRSSAAFLRLFS
jgi:Glycosyl hydrolase family 26